MRSAVSPIFRSFYLYLPTYLSIYVSMYLSMYIYLSIYVPTFQHLYIYIYIHANPSVRCTDGLAGERKDQALDFRATRGALRGAPFLRSGLKNVSSLGDNFENVTLTGLHL